MQVRVVGQNGLSGGTALAGDDPCVRSRRGFLAEPGPGGLWVFSPAGETLGTILTPRHVHNMAWGDADGRSLYLCARDRLYRMRLTPGGGAR